ncbi:GGDEF domain-containing protein [Marinobacter sp. X15-166B]|uniref:GGDEF domain-containing protein n=1 Tax=Marinobacter sp. X15-166B TaxID=1897620 RepID=UPI00085BDB14|nr:GGDEF domain-containing protein [Marinobacter sp. X15-166B]OEY66724.1 diguanylate cyclase [Marinobacter sp. X15-166B]
MTETRLRTLTHLSGYGLATLFIATLAVQNLLYGLYRHFFLASALAALTLAGVGYTLLSRRQQLNARGHLFILAGLNALAITALFALQSTMISHWLLPLLVLNMLVLPLRQGAALSALTILMLALHLWGASSAADTLLVSVAACILLTVCGLYVWHYDHMAQSAQDLAITDPVTGAHNARFLDETLQKEVSRATATGHPLSTIALSLDHLDDSQPLYLQGASARLYREITQHLFGVIRAGDTLYTLGDGRFFLVLPFTPEEGVRVIAERIRRSIAEASWPSVGHISASLGCATLGASETDPDTLRQRTEHALTTACNRGCDSVAFTSAASIRA